jgi:hypothetical protein
MAENSGNSGEKEVNNSTNGAAAKASNSPKGYKPELIARSPSFLAKALKNYTESGTRGLFERHAVGFQCEAVIGPVGKGRICWLCGFPIANLLALRNDENKPVFTVDTPMLDRAVCEHVLPVKLGHALLELLYLARDPVYGTLLHTEYEYAHNFCNIIKGANYFATLPLGSTNFCDLSINEDVVNEFLRLNFYTQRGAPGSSQYSLVSTFYKGREIEFINPVQAYCFASSPSEYLVDSDAFYRDKWFPRAKKLIMDKMNRLVSYIKEIDNCAKNNNSKGLHFSGVESRLRTGLPALKRGLKGPTPATLEDKFPAEFERYKKVLALQRQASAEELLKGYSNEERLLPFRTPSFSGYTINNSNLLPRSRPSSGETKKSKGSRKSKSSNESARVSPVEDALAAERNAGLAALAVEEAEAEEAAVAVEEAEAEEAAVAVEASRVLRPRLARQLGSRKLVNRSNSSNSNYKNTSSSENEGVALRSAFSRRAAKPKPKANNTRRSFKKGLRIAPKENGIYITGKTFNYKNNIKKIPGYKWDSTKKAWVVPLNANLSPIQE